MMLELSEMQARDLRDALERHLTELLKELVHTDDRTFRANLNAEHERLERIRKRLDAALESSQAYA